MPPLQKVYCPDCEQWIKQPEFVAHREREHQPEPLVLATTAIRSQIKFGTDPPDKETD